MKSLFVSINLYHFQSTICHLHKVLEISFSSHLLSLTFKHLRLFPMKTNSFGNFIITKIPTPLCQLQSITGYPRLASILASFESTKHSGRIMYTSVVIFPCRNFVLTFILPYPINEICSNC